MTDEGARILPTAVTKAYDVLLWLIKPQSLILEEGESFCLLCMRASRSGRQVRIDP
jgi:hypothetical protein